MRRFFAVTLLISVAVFSVNAQEEQKEAPVAQEEAPVAQEEAPAVQEDIVASATSYSILKGDTLWDITGRHYGNAWLWPKLWQVNKAQIDDPDLILPEQLLDLPDKKTLEAVVVEMGEKEPARETAAEPVEEMVLPGVPAMEEEPAAEPEPEEVAEEITAEEELPAEIIEEEPVVEAPAEERPEVDEAKLMKQYFNWESKFVSRGWSPDGTIMGSKERKLMISAGDTVYVDLGKDKISKGAECVVLRKGRKMKSNDVVGYEIIRVGKIQITGEGDNISTAKVTMSYEPIQTGDLLKVVGE
ncbi:MAG: LysM peptidoglycan-binding domain-containing protein [Endomicrobiales bacterium]|nr:LysM peptidoglycan-binding domain-containing protein [Endomicrobiales bacterium]